MPLPEGWASPTPAPRKSGIPAAILLRVFITGPNHPAADHTDDNPSRLK